MNKQERSAPLTTWFALALAAAALGTAATGCEGAEEAADTSAEPDVAEGTAAIGSSAGQVADSFCVNHGQGPKPCSTAKCMGYFEAGWEYWWDSSSCGSTQTLGLEKWGTGQGTVASSPSGISCGTSCWSASKAYTTGTNVTLTATPAPGNVFARWENGCTGNSPTCTVTMGQARTVRAVFEALVPLTVLKEGSGTGIVVDQSFGLIYCGPSQTECTLAYWMYTPVNLVPLASPGSYFAGWSGGGCAGTGPCTVTVDVAKAVTAHFRAL